MNLYGYVDYHGPNIPARDCLLSEDDKGNSGELEDHYDDTTKDDVDVDDDEDRDPLRPGVWMEGDSLPPPVALPFRQLIMALLR